MLILRVGDPHAKVGVLEEEKALVIFVGEQAKLLGVDRIELLGDLFHTHNVIRLEVLEFWTWALDYLSQICEVVVLVGNHDQTGDYNSTFSALSVFGLMNKKNLVIVEKPTLLGVFGYAPYTHNPDAFIASVGDLATAGARVLVCHQTIEGSKYESGIYAPDGIPPGQWAERFVHVISGHIHSEQAFGNFIYPGTARWDSSVDANRRKGIWCYDHEDGGSIKSATFITTEQVCSPIESIEWREGDPEPELRNKENTRLTIELIGSSVWIAAQKEKLKGKCSLKTKTTDKKASAVRKTGNSFEHFMKDIFPTKHDRVKLMKYAKEIGIV